MAKYIYHFAWVFSLIFAVVFYFVLRSFELELSLLGGLHNVNWVLLGLALLFSNIPILVVTFTYWITEKLTKTKLLVSYIFLLLICCGVIALYQGIELFKLSLAV